MCNCIAVFALKNSVRIVLSLGVLLLSTGIASAQGEAVEENSAATVYVPEGSDLAYQRKADNPDFISFSGAVELTGILLAYWQLDYLDAEPDSLLEANTEHGLQLRFYPDSRSSQLLPSFAEGGRGKQTPVQRIFLYHSREKAAFFDDFEMSYAAEDADRIRSIAAHFSELPEGFLEGREGKALQPARVLIDGLASYIEGNHRFTVGSPQDIRAISMTEYSLAQISDAQPGGYLSQPWVNYLYLVEDAAMLDAPDGKVLRVLEAGTHNLERLGPPRQGWAEVRYQGVEPALQGYIDAAVLRPVN